MKTWKFSLILLSAAWPILPLLAQSDTDETQKKALELLRQTLAKTERPQTPVSPQVRQDPTLAEKEKQYLAGKIDAKQFQQYLQEHSAQPVQPVAPAIVETQTNAVQLLRQTLATVDTAAPAQGTPAPVAPSVAVLSPPQPSGLTEVEAKMDELLRLKAARDKAAQDKAAQDKAAAQTNPAAPKTKRERLDELLRLHIAGTISEADYKEKRSQIIAEKE